MASSINNEQNNRFLFFFFKKNRFFILSRLLSTYCTKIINTHFRRQGMFAVSRKKYESIKFTGMIPFII